MSWLIEISNTRLGASCLHWRAARKLLRKVIGLAETRTSLAPHNQSFLGIDPPSSSGLSPSPCPPHPRPSSPSGIDKPKFPYPKFPLLAGPNIQPVSSISDCLETAWLVLSYSYPVTTVHLARPPKLSSADGLRLTQSLRSCHV